jgi:hypothetical protein
MKRLTLLVMPFFLLAAMAALQRAHGADPPQPTSAALTATLAKADPNYALMLVKAVEIQNAQASALEAFGMAAAAKAKELPAAIGACATMKSEAVQTICVLGVNGNLAGGVGGGGQMPQFGAVNLPGPPPEKPSLGGQLWAATLQVVDRGLQVFGIREGRYERTEIARVNAGVQIAQTQGMVAVAVAGVNGAAAGYPYVQAPGAVTTTTTTDSRSYSLGGSGVIGNGSYTGPVSIQCTTGQGGGAAPATPPAVPGAGGPSGANNC